MERGAVRFFSNPEPIQRDYLMEECRAGADSQGIESSVHIQVVAEDGFAEAEWIQAVADDNPEWLMVQMVFCDLFSEDLERHQRLSTVREVRQIVSRALTEDARTGANALLDNARFTKEPQAVGERPFV